MQYQMLLFSLLACFACGAKNKAADAGANHDGELVNEDEIGEWNGFYAPDGDSDKGELNNQVSMSLLLYKDLVFIMVFDEDKSKYLKGTYARFSDEIVFTVDESSYESFAGAPSTLIAKFELSKDNLLKLHFGNVRSAYLGRNQAIKVQGSKEDPSPTVVDSGVKNLTCLDDKKFTVMIGLDTNSNIFSASIFANGSSESKPPRYKGLLETVDSQTMKLAIASRKDEKQEIEAFLISSIKDAPQSVLRIQFKDGTEKILGCSSGG